MSLHLRVGAGQTGRSGLILPVIYACVVWYVAMRWRRRWPSFMAVGASVMLLGAVGIGLRSVHAAVEFGAQPSLSITGPLRNPVVEALLWPYTGMVMAVGVYIACLPRSAPSEAHCRGCHYDLSGMNPEGLVCPECGAAQEYRCLACNCDLGGRSPVGLKCPDCCTVWEGPGWRGFPGWDDKRLACTAAVESPGPPGLDAASAA